MAAFDFPNSPSVNDTYSANGMTFTWNGTKWERTSPSVGAQGATGPTGPTGSTCLLYTSPSPRDRQKSRMPSSA